MYNECDSLCFKTKNLYNACLYLVKENYFKKVNILYNLHNLMKNSEQYKELPAKVSSSVLLSVIANFKSYFKANAEYNKHSLKFNNKPKLPNYLDKITGRFFASYTNQAISKKIFKKSNKIKLSLSNIEVKTKINNFNDINCVRIIPRNNYYVIEIIYTIPDKEKLMNNNIYASIDLGLNNLATITSNIIDIKPIIINGKPLKSINQYYNKRKSKLQSILEIRNNNKTSKNLYNLELKKKNKIDNYLHKASKLIVGYCVKNNINSLIIGKNDNWKQDINIGKVNNQNFVNIPHSRFINMISYKCEREGINVIINEESYTSKASFIDLDTIPKYMKNTKNNYKFSGMRISRGLYKSKFGRIINADVNGSYNILRKVVPNVFNDGIEGVGVHPKVITLNK